MSEYIRELIAASRRIRGYVHFTVANEMAHPDDLSELQSWLDALSRCEKHKKSGKTASRRGGGSES